MQRLQLSNPFLEGANNVYLLDEEPPVTLLDTGVSTSQTVEKFQARLDIHDLGFDDVGQILVTHWHTDHAGMAGDIQAAGGASVYVHERDAAIARQDDAAWTSMEVDGRAGFEAWGMPDDELELSIDHIDIRDEYWGEPATVDSFTGGRRFDLGGQTAKAVHTPGHTLGSTSFRVDTTNELFVGDTLLPAYTPNIGGSEFRDTGRALEQYLSTLRWLQASDVETAYPGHGSPITDPADRAYDTIVHHFDRMRDVLNVLRDQGPLNPWKMARHLFGELNSIHVPSGGGEAAIHLRYLHNHGILERTAEGYELLAAAEERFEAHIESTFGSEYLD